MRRTSITGTGGCGDPSGRAGGARFFLFGGGGDAKGDRKAGRTHTPFASPGLELAEGPCDLWRAARLLWPALAPRVSPRSAGWVRGSARATNQATRLPFARLSFRPGTGAGTCSSERMPYWFKWDLFPCENAVEREGVNSAGRGREASSLPLIHLNLIVSLNNSNNRNAQ